MTISWCLGVKPAAAKFDLISSLDGKSASIMARTTGKKFGTTTSFSRVPVRMQMDTQLGVVDGYLAELHGEGVNLMLME